MLNHNFRIFYRNINRSKTTHLINLAGLSGGLACGLLIYLWIYNERQVDRFYPNVERILSRASIQPYIFPASAR